MLVQTQSHTLRHLTTAHLAQTMTLLELSTLELRQKIDAELARNPALELLEDRHCPTCGRSLPGNRRCIWCVPPPLNNPEQPIVFTSAPQDFYFRSGSHQSPSDEFLPEDTAQEIEDLPVFVMRQIAPELSFEDRPIAAHILTALTEDGLLAVPLAEIALYHHVPLSRIQKIIRLIQHADPIGVGSPNPTEALLVQLEILAETMPIPPLAAQAIQAGLELLSYHRLSDLAHTLHISRTQAHLIYQFISANLNPYPARAHWGDVQTNRHSAPANQNAYYTPDVIISRLTDKEDAPLVVEVVLPLQGQLRINPLFREALQQADPEKSEQWKNDFEQASLLVKCIQQRNHTLVRMMERLATLQRKFILYGDEHLQPVTRAQIAQELSLHESTISRAVSEKSAQLPNGHIVPLSRFFDRSLHIRSALRQLIAAEEVPLSDSELGEKLALQGYRIARRTVAKYRSMEGILPAHLRVRIAG
jgi:RNA polymerase sigma-54 factor